MDLFPNKQHRKVIDRRWRRKQHIYDGFPHYHHETGHCMCLAEMCCNDTRPGIGTGCICPSCMCNYGYPHGES